jgi:hypothetical protein
MGRHRAQLENYLLFRVWDSALAATLLTAFEELLLERILEALEATALLVCLVFAMCTPPFVLW